MSQPAPFLVGHSCTIADMAALLDAWHGYWPTQPVWHVDVSQLADADGAGLQFLVGLAHQAHLQQRELQWLWMPEDSNLSWLKTLVQQLQSPLREVNHD